MSQIIHMGCHIVCKRQIMLYHNMQGYNNRNNNRRENAYTLPEHAGYG